jgi:pimeloyl-ACP methyl ester carboxylesterase
MQCIVDNRMVGYDLAGKGKVIVLLHGWGANRKSLAPLMTRLSQPYTVLALDVPGFGESEKPVTDWDIGEYADWVQSALRKLDIKNVYALIGHSNGGAIAIKLASNGFTLQKLVLLGSAGIRKHNSGKKLFYKAISKTGKLATLAFPAKLKTKVRDRWYKQIGSELYHAPGMEETFKKVTSEDMLVDAAMISVPTLLIYGSNDEATPPLYGRMYHEAIEGSELDIVEGVGHYSFVDKPDVVCRRVEDFLK